MNPGDHEGQTAPASHKWFCATVLEQLQILDRITLLTWDVILYIAIYLMLQGL